MLPGAFIPKKSSESAEFRNIGFFIIALTVQAANSAGASFFQNSLL